MYELRFSSRGCDSYCGYSWTWFIRVLSTLSTDRTTSHPITITITLPLSNHVYAPEDLYGLAALFHQKDHPLCDGGRLSVIIMRETRLLSLDDALRHMRAMTHEAFAGLDEEGRLEITESEA